MKKILSLVLVLVMIASAVSLVACNEKKDEKTADTTAAVTTAAATDAETEAETEEDTTVEETLADGETTVKELYEDELEVPVYTIGENRTPTEINAVSKGYGFRFTLPEGQWVKSISACCPSYSDNIGSLTFYIYKYDTDLKTSVAAEPICKQTFEDFTDNETLCMDLSMLDTPVEIKEAGQYIFLIKDGVDNGTGDGTHAVGVWMESSYDEYDAEDFAEYEIAPIQNGKIATKSKSIVQGTILFGMWS